MRSSDRVTKLLLYSVVLPFFLGCSDPDPQNSKPLARAASQQGAETTLRAYNVALQTYKTELQLREKLEQELASAISSFQLETQRGHQMFAEAIRSDLEQERLIEHSGGSDEEKARKLKSLSDLAEERLQAHKDRYKWRVAAYNTFSADLNRRIEDQRARVKTAERIRDQAARHLPTQTD